MTEKRGFGLLFDWVESKNSLELIDELHHLLLREARVFASKFDSLHVEIEV